ncbi:hypothetical protein ACMGE5_00225 [Macrococcus equi]|uniref:hypothetical protein n=1 Tax=Macrococcus equi TaxID=3395462 RepID=UPI0039BE104B
MEFIGAFFLVLSWITVYLVPIIIIVLIVSYLYNTRQNTKYLIHQNEQIIKLLEQIVNREEQK